MHSNTMRNLNSGAWATPNPNHCACRGYGWLHSDYDTYHKCPIHNVGQPHPEMDADMMDNYERMPDGRPMGLIARPDYRRIVMVNAYRWARNQVAKALSLSYTDTNIMIEESLPSSDRSDKAWVNAAYELADYLQYEAWEEQARAMGYSCRLEAALDLAARAEHEGFRASSDFYH